MEDVTAARAAKALADAAGLAASNAQTDATAATSSIAAIVDDGKLDRSEKPELIQRYNTIYNEHSGIYNQAHNLSLTTVRDEYYSAFTLVIGSATLPVGWDNVAVDTAVNRSTFNANFTSYYVKKQALLDAVAAELRARAASAATTATWAGIPSGSGKPQDNATVGAPAGSPVAGVPGETLVAQVATAHAAATAPTFTITQKANSSFSTPVGNYFRNVGSFSVTVNNAPAGIVYSWRMSADNTFVVIDGATNSATINLKGKCVAATGVDVYLTCTAVSGNKTATMTFNHYVDFYE